MALEYLLCCRCAATIGRTSYALLARLADAKRPTTQEAVLVSSRDRLFCNHAWASGDIFKLV
jgi:hypothetical protein